MTGSANEPGSLKNQLLEPMPSTCFSWTEAEVNATAFRLFLLTGSEGSEYLKIAGARRLAEVAQFGLARLAQEQVLRIYKRIAFGELAELKQLFGGEDCLNRASEPDGMNLTDSALLPSIHRLC